MSTIPFRNIPSTLRLPGAFFELDNSQANTAQANQRALIIGQITAAGGEAIPAGLTCTITAMSGGATNPTLTTALGNLGNMSFDFIACPYTDPTSLTAVSGLLNDTTGRWSWQSQLYGHSISAFAGTFAAQTTLGLTQNNQHQTILGFYNSPTPSLM